MNKPGGAEGSLPQKGKNGGRAWGGGGGLRRVGKQKKKREKKKTQIKEKKRKGRRDPPGRRGEKPWGTETEINQQKRGREGPNGLTEGGIVHSKLSES